MKNEEKLKDPKQSSSFVEDADNASEYPSFFRVVWKEILHDKVALVSLILFCLILIVVFVGSTFYSQDDTVRVSLGSINKPPSSKWILGTDPSGRDMLGQLFVGARNSFLIAFGITIACAIIGVLVGLVAGFYGGIIDNIIMRVLDFMSMIPYLMVIIVIVSIIPSYNVMTLVIVITIFSWQGKARLIRAKTLQQSNLDYVHASKTLGTSNFIIMFREVLPNIISIIVVNLTLNLAANMGVETGLSFLGFGLPFSTPSLGTLLSYASSPQNIQNRPWQWAPPLILILVMMLCINFVGQAVKKAADAKQRT